MPDSTKSAEIDSAKSSVERTVQQTVGRAALVVMLFFVLSRVAGLAREVIIGAQFGASAELDAYLAAFRVPDILFQLVAGGALGSAFIPTFAEYWADNDEQGAWLLLSRVINLVTLLLLIMAATAAFFALPIAQLVAPGLTPEQQLLTANLMRWMLVGTVIFGASGLIMGALNAVQHFLLPAAAPIFYNLAIILGALFLSPTMGAYGLAIGTVFGAILHLAIQVPGLVRHRYRYQFGLTLRDKGVRNVLWLMGPRALGLFAVQMQFLVNTILASGLPVGSISALNYAWLIMLLPQGVFAQAIATAVFPTFAAQVAAGNHHEMRSTFSYMLRTVLFLTIPAAVGLYVLRVPLIQVLLERGEFTSDTTHLVAYALQFYALGLVAHSVLEVIVRAFYALHDTMTPVIVGIGAMVLNIILSIWWIDWLSYGGLALANSFATTLEALILLWLLRSKTSGIEAKGLLNSVARTGIAAAIMGCGVWAWLRWSTGIEWSGNPLLANGFNALSSVIIAALSYASISLLINRDEMMNAIALFLRRR